jgi:glycosyltransferase involved in cell wall biosynthesis
MISVCLATYNGERFLKQQIDSILNQLDDEGELIISDDNSTDNTVGIINSYNDSRINFFLNHNRKGVVGNFENALMNAKGEYIFLCDQDDIWLSNKISTCINYLKYNDLVVTDCSVVDENLNILEPSFFKIRNSGKGFWKNLYKNTYLGACIAFKKESLNYILPFPKSLPVFHEGWIASLIDIKGKVIFISDCTVLYRRHNNNVSMTVTKSEFSFWKQLSFRFHFLFLIILRLIKFI